MSPAIFVNHRISVSIKDGAAKNFAQNPVVKAADAGGERLVERKMEKVFHSRGRL